MFKLLGILLITALLTLSLVGCSKPPLTLTVSEPMDGATVTTSSLTVRGTVSDPKAVVTVNDKRVYPSSKTGNFSSITKVTLAEGENIITVVATRGKEVITTTVTITYTR